MNFRGVRDFTEDKQRYEKVLAYLANIQHAYPYLYHDLQVGAPQLEYEIENCRVNARYARRYLLELTRLVFDHEQKLRSEATRTNIDSVIDFDTIINQRVLKTQHLINEEWIRK